VIDRPQFTVSFGAALYAKENFDKGSVKETGSLVNSAN
jgi:hypothetical protein